MSKNLKTILIVLIGAGLLCFAGMGLFDPVFHARIKDLPAVVVFKEYIYWPSLKAMISLYRSTVINPVFYIAVAIILFLKRLWPANRNQKIFSFSFFQDSVWIVYEALFQAIILAAYAEALMQIYRNHFSFLTIPWIGTLPFASRFLLGVLIADFLGWLHHWIKHKGPLFWQFHLIHHSQQEINMFTDMRYHFVEYLISRTVVVFPMLIFSINIDGIIYYSIFHTWFTRLYHSNIRSNFWLLRYIFVTPQSLRVHHSVEQRHQDQNYGVLFSFWDRLFGTQYEGCDEYPQTGIADERFPHEKKVSALDLVLTPIRQVVYPFKVVGGWIRDIKRK